VKYAAKVNRNSGEGKGEKKSDPLFAILIAHCYYPVICKASINLHYAFAW